MQRQAPRLGLCLGRRPSAVVVFASRRLPWRRRARCRNAFVSGAFGASVDVIVDRFANHTLRHLAQSAVESVGERQVPRASNVLSGTSAELEPGWLLLRRPRFAKRLSPYRRRCATKSCLLSKVGHTVVALVVAFL